MPRKMIIRKDGKPHSLSQVIANNEEELQELVKANPDILPFEEYGLIGPLMVVGRETVLPSGSVDLVGLARSGDILIVEFKTGPQNTDFRAAIAQLIDYGSDLWGMSYEEFENTVAIRYFASNRCKDASVSGKASLTDAQLSIWPDMTDEELSNFQEKLVRQLETGGFRYLLVAGRFTSPIERTIEYMNHISSSASFYAVELVSFTGDNLSAFETRTLVMPRTHPPGKPPNIVGEKQFIESIPDEEYKHAVQDFFEVCRGLGLNFEWGSVGTSIRMQIISMAESVSVAWIFPPGKSGWMGLKDLTLGYDIGSAARVAFMEPVLQDYAQKVGALPEAVRAKPQNLNAFCFSPKSLINNIYIISDLLAELVQKSGEVSK